MPRPQITEGPHIVLVGKCRQTSGKKKAPPSSHGEEPFSG